MKVLITGATGQLGYWLQKLPPENVEGVIADRAALDLAKPESLQDGLALIGPEVIINAAAYTAVDAAEKEREAAFSINAEAVGEMAAYCGRQAIPLIHVSTDFVFDGKTPIPYLPEAPTAPVNVYGASKRLGEKHALALCDSCYIVRTGWLYCEHGKNFVKTMLHLAAKGVEPGVVADQIGTPTYAAHLADMIWRLLEARPEKRIWHFSDAGVASWYDFAAAIFEDAFHIGLVKQKLAVRPLTSADYPTPAARPAYSVLDKCATWNTLNITPVHWREALQKMLCNYSEHFIFGRSALATNALLLWQGLNGRT